MAKNLTTSSGSEAAATSAASAQPPQVRVVVDDKSGGQAGAGRQQQEPPDGERQPARSSLIFKRLDEVPEPLSSAFEQRDAAQLLLFLQQRRRSQ